MPTNQEMPNKPSKSNYKDDKRTTKTMPTRFEVPLFAGNKNEKGFEYDRETLLEIVNSVPFNKISIPLYAEKSTLDSSLQIGDGVKPVGYISDYDIATETFTVFIYSFFADIIGKLKDAIIFPRVYIKKYSSKDINILNLIVGPVESYEKLL